MQALSIAWSVKDRRWFHLYPRERITHSDSRTGRGPRRRWFGHDPRGSRPFASAFAKATARAVDASAELRKVAADASQAAIVRATAMSRLDAAANAATIDVVARGLRDESPLIRMGALGAFENVPPDIALRHVAPLLSDPRRAIRIDAARVLANVPSGRMNPADRSAFERAASEYVASQHYNADLVEARVNLGSFEARRGDGVRAEQHFKSAIALNPAFVPAYVNLAIFTDRSSVKRKPSACCATDSRSHLEAPHCIMRSGSRWCG
jgi:hypothetical protein